MVGTSDLDKEVVCNYAAVHCGLTNEMIENYPDYPSKEEMVKDLTDKNLGYDFQKDKSYDWAKLAKKKDKTKGIEKYWLADKLSKNFGDIMKIKSLPKTDVLFFSSPCQDWSSAGKQAGGNWTCLDCGENYSPYDSEVSNRYTCPHCGSHNIKSTRSGLLFEVERLLVDYESRECLPKYLVLENVSALVSKKFINDFNAWLQRLESLGYNNYWHMINSKECGVPQSRERVFCVSIRKDIDAGRFEFPKPFDSGIRLRDVLEDDINIISKYFLSDEVQSRLKITDHDFKKNIIGTTIGDNCTRYGERDVVYQENSIMGALCSSDYKQPKQLYVGEKSIIGTTAPDYRSIGQRDRVYNPNSYIAALESTDYKQPKQLYVGDNKPIQSGTLMGKYEKMMDVSRRVYDENGISPTLHTCSGGNTEPKVSRNNLKVVRKLTPKECFRLQSFDDIDYERCKALNMSDTQGYKAMGNSICVRCIELIAQHLFKAQYDPKYECYDEKVLEYQEEMKHAPYYVSEFYGAASRGRYNDEGKIEQHLEINSPDYSNCLTSVQKDSLIAEFEKDDFANFMNPPME